MDWEEYLIEIIKFYRREFQNLDQSFREVIRKEFFEKTLLKPCQIEVLASSGEVGCFIVHDKKIDDMQIKVVENAKSYDESDFVEKYNFKTMGIRRKHRPLLKEVYLVFWDRHNYSIAGKDEIPKPESAAEDLLDRVRIRASEHIKKKQVDSIAKSTGGLKASISKLPESKIRSELTSQAKLIDGALGEIRRIDRDLGGIRRLMGTTKEYQEWRLLVSDVNRLKGEHVPREIFDTEVRRIDEKIDKGLKALTTRIEDLKAIKFWSKRTLLEIALAIITVIAALYGAGVIKF